MSELLVAATNEPSAAIASGATTLEASVPQYPEYDPAAQNDEKLLSHTLPDGSVVTGTREQAEIQCPVIRNMSPEEREITFEEHDLMQQLIANRRAQKVASQKENSVKSNTPMVKPRKEQKSEPKVARPTQASPSREKNKPAVNAPEQAHHHVSTIKPAKSIESENNLSVTNRSEQNVLLQETAVRQEVLKKPESVIVKPGLAEPIAETPKVIYTENHAPAENNKATVIDIRLIQNAQEQQLPYEAATEAIANVLHMKAINKDEAVYQEPRRNVLILEETPDSLAAAKNATASNVEDVGISGDELVANSAITKFDFATDFGDIEVTNTSEDPLVSESLGHGSADSTNTDDFWQADNTDTSEFKAPEESTIRVNSEKLDTAETTVGEDALRTHQQLLEIIVDAAEAQAVANQTDTEHEELAEAPASTEKSPALNIVEIIRAEPSIAEEPTTMEQAKADGRNAPPLEQALAKLSIVLEASPGQTDEPVIKLLAEIAEKIVAEPAEAKEGTIDNQPVAITPEITQLFINLLEELGYEDPPRTLISFVSQYGIDELIDSAIYLHQLAESGDQKEYLSNQLPAMGSDSTVLPLTTLIGKTIFRIIRPEVQTLTAAA